MGVGGRCIRWGRVGRMSERGWEGGGGHCERRFLGRVLGDVRCGWVRIDFDCYFRRLSAGRMDGWVWDGMRLSVEG